MNIIFAGTPRFAAQALISLLTKTPHKVVLVLTQPDRAAGRGMKVTPSAVKAVARQYHLNLYQPTTLKSVEAQQILQQTKADLMIVAAYGLILPQAVLDIPRYGCLNIHASILPRWRGAAPIERAILAGDTYTGITIMQMNAGLDTGDILFSQRIPIMDNDTAATLHDKLAICGEQSIVDTLVALPQYTAARQTQPQIGVTYAEKLQKEEAKINWSLPAVSLVRQIRAFTPRPGSYTFYKQNLIKLWQASVVPVTGQPGEILTINNKGITIACKDTAICVTSLQRSGGQKMDAAQFLTGFPLTVGEFFT